MMKVIKYKAAIEFTIHFKKIEKTIQKLLDSQKINNALYLQILI